jgi:FtsP/CotA-like multicopper oxidase with cupredoxin domain
MQSFLSFKGLVSSLLFVGLATAAPTTQDLEVRGPGSCYGPTNRQCWDTGFDITTDYEADTPAGNVVSYNWEITEHRDWIGPDGVQKDLVQLINGQLPGPVLHASWGDTISVTITNKLANNG